jgi:hypothetical protein
MRAVSGIFTGALVMAVVAGGCQHSEDRYLKREVTAEEVVGTWQMTPATVKDLHDSGYTAPVDPAQHQIVLRPDGTCDFKTSPRVLTEVGKPAARVEVPCRWKLGNVGHQALLIDIESQPPERTYYHFSEGPSMRLELWQHAGDPDAWRYVEYVKQ